MINIFYNEWKGFLRNKLFIFFASFFIILLFIVTYFAIVQNNKQIQSQNELLVLEIWKEQKVDKETYQEYLKVLK